jgi:hypothetical protein
MDAEIIARMNEVFPRQSRLRALFRVALLTATVLAAPCAAAQPTPSAPPAVGVITVESRPMTDSYEFNGRIQATDIVNIVARVTAFMEKQLFVEGSDVKKGDLLYILERQPFQAAVDLQKAAIAQAEAQLENANISLARPAAAAEKCRDPTGGGHCNGGAAHRSGPIAIRAGPARERTDQSGLYGNSLPDRWPDWPYVGDCWQCGQPDIRYPYHGSQPGSGARVFFGSDAPRHRVTRAVRR